MGVKFTCSQEDMLKVAHLSLRRLGLTPGIVNARTKPLNRQLVKFVYICAIWKLKTKLLRCVKKFQIQTPKQN